MIIRSTAIIAKNCTIFRQQSPQIALLACLGHSALVRADTPMRIRIAIVGPVTCRLSNDFDALFADRPDLVTQYVLAAFDNIARVFSETQPIVPLS